MSNLLNDSAKLRIIARSNDVSPTHFLYARYPHPKSLPSKGLTLALAGSISGVSHLRNLIYMTSTALKYLYRDISCSLLIGVRKVIVEISGFSWSFFNALKMKYSAVVKSGALKVFAI